MLAGTISPVRGKVVYGQGFTQVVFRRAGRWKYAVRLMAFAAVWLFGGGFASLLIAALPERQWMLGLWLSLWVVGGMVVLGLLLWGLLGVESLVAHADRLTLTRRLLLFRHATDIPASGVERLVFLPDNPARVVRVNGRRIPQTAIEISGDAGSVRFADGIGEAEAAAAIAALRQRLDVGRRKK